MATCFTIEVDNDVSVIPFSKAMAAAGYSLKWSEDGRVVRLTETPARKAEIEAAHARLRALRDAG